MQQFFKFLRYFFITLFIFSITACVYEPSFKRDQRGSYRGSFYQVNNGDTLYFVSYITDRDVNEIIAYNLLTPPYTIHPGQKLKLWNTAYSAPAYGKATASSSNNSETYQSSSANSTQSVQNNSTTSEQVVASSNTNDKTKVYDQSVNSSIDQNQSSEYVSQTSKQNVNEVTATTSSPTPVPVQPVSKASYDQKISQWVWPTKGSVVRSFSLSEQGNKGIDIVGSSGQDVVSTANGTVVYAGNALAGYGNLVIIKHNEEYLSAYAHNQKLYVKEGEAVIAGQKVAAMGNTGADRTKLHFEIRYKGKPVNPTNYLPKT